ncbi:amidohydrolase family protein [Variovorax paradoxus]|nr:amidohydrolase family protein [Variovorax paradoxus]
MTSVGSSPTRADVRPEWLAATREEPLEPDIPVVDSHHHLYDRPGSRYLLDDFLADTSGGHHVRASVIVQARAMLRADAPPALQPLGETEFANGVAAMSASGIYGQARIGAAIVGQADLLLGDEVRPILERHVLLAGGSIAEGGRFRGIRHIVAWDRDSSFVNPVYPATESTMDSTAFREGFAHLGRLGLSFDAWLFFHQIPRLTVLARAFPETRIVLNHCGGILRIGTYAGRSDGVFALWSSALRELAECANVMVKLSGLGMRLSGFGFEAGRQAPASSELAAAWRPWMETCIDAFGPARCMWGSNFPVDKGSYGYTVGLNAIKRVLAGASEGEKEDILWRSAQRFYRIRAQGLAI